MKYAWLITRDHLHERFKDDGSAGCNDDTGMSGPHDAPEALLGRLKAGDGYVFKLYDDDGELYYTGRLLAAEKDATGDFAHQPLEDFGTGWAGCTSVRYPGRPDWNCG